MLHRLPSWLLGPLTFLLLVLNLAVMGTTFVLIMPLKWLGPTRRFRQRTFLVLQGVFNLWAKSNSAVLDLTQRVEWRISGLEQLDPAASYLIVSNHSSWLDIPVVLRVLVGRTSMIKIFLKHELIWVPLLGIGCWALEFPFMRRYPPEKVQKHPELKGKDLETTRRTCRNFGRTPSSLLNYMEGTRYTRRKHRAQKSPYRHLLKPKSGGVAFILGTVGDRLDAMVDISLAYPARDRIFWEFISGRVAWVAVDVRLREIPVEFRSDATWNDPETRERYREWIRSIWQEKDDWIDRTLQLGQSSKSPAFEVPESIRIDQD